MNYILFDDATWQNLLPLTFTKPVSEIRIGILTITEKWETYLNGKLTFQTQEYLSSKFKAVYTNNAVFINGKICPTPELLAQINNLEFNKGIKKGNTLIAYRSNTASALNIEEALSSSEETTINYVSVENTWDIFSKNGEAIKQDFELLTRDKTSQSLSSSNTVIGDAKAIFLEEGAVVEAAILNTKSGPIYIGKDAEIMEGSVVRGPFALCEHSALKLSTKVYGPTTIGPHSKVGGEINNSVVFGFSNKAHDGFLGNSVIGEWCNLGADTNNSNLKNNYGNVKLYNYAQQKMVDTGLQFCGLTMGDHSKCGINTMFNTGTVVGVGANIFGGGFPPTHIPSFSWGGAEGMEDYQFDKMIETANRVYARRSISMSAEEKQILQTVFDKTKKDRK
ncbi:MAG: glucose-1-phosphate thymidylyltransferase [Sphingobacteriaceae bacterium]|nr:glucose-1-phosphate thymidylyltransferase [Sphingobacteriaceae bacterium]